MERVMEEITQDLQGFYGSFSTPPSLPIGIRLYRYIVENFSHLLFYYQIPRIRRNLSLITQIPGDDPRINQWTNSICQNMIYSYIELFLDLGKGIHSLLKKVQVDHQDLERIRQEAARGRGVVLTGIHTCGSDHGMYCINHYLPGIQLLSKANPNSRNRFMSYLRKLHHILITPISIPALKDAISRLRSGGIVGVAIDIPIPSGDCFEFFEQNCFLTTAHTRMAVYSGAVIFLVHTLRTPSGQYQVRFQQVKQPSNCPNKSDLITTWAQQSYRQVEKLILRWPDAWYGTSFDLFPQAGACAS
jgi:lauroyl/myristoyl acyltransferase